MPKRLILLLAFLTAAPAFAQTAPGGDAVGPTAIPSAAIDNEAGDKAAPANLRYQTGAFFYGNDCGGNSAMTAGAARTNLPPGVILAGAGGHQVAALLNCDDRRSAMGSYRDAFQGNIGQPYAWKNPNGAANGNVMAMRRYQEGGSLCVSYRAAAVIDQHPSSSNGTACRRPDGNWHTQ